MRTIAIGSDHGGFALKEEIKAHLQGREDIKLEDYGTHSAESCNYPGYAEQVAASVVRGDADLGILVCGTGIGMSMAANKVPGIRAAVVSDCFSAKATRNHNDANILCLGQRVLGGGLALMIVDTFLSAEYEGGRHQPRLDMITDLEERSRRG